MLFFLKPFTNPLQDSFYFSYIIPILMMIEYRSICTTSLNGGFQWTTHFFMTASMRSPIHYPLKVSFTPVFTLQEDVCDPMQPDVKFPSFFDPVATPSHAEAITTHVKTAFQTAVNAPDL